MGIRIQTIEVTFSDGRVGTFTGPAVVAPEDEGKLTVAKIRVSEAVDLPDEYSFEGITPGRVDAPK